MVRFFQILLIGILTSLFFFPFEFMALPGINTKMMLAVTGLFFVAFQLVKRRTFTIPIELLALVFIAGAVSLVSLLSITINQTPDTTYVSYIVSFSVWLSAAFAVCCCMKAVHREIGVQLVLNYLTGVCVFQCIMALVIDSYPAVQSFVDRYIAQGQDLMHEINRLYGIGALLDVAGARFSAVLVGLGFYLSEVSKPLKPGTRVIYIISFLVISIIGNMIARTALVGVAVGLGFIILGQIFRPSDYTSNQKQMAFFTWVGVLAIGILICVVLYNTNPQARRLFRFGFEGFFSLVEKGHWETSSTDKLVQTMVVFPETLHTWIIGDGYFLNSRYDVNYLGDATDQGFYMGTDVGYLRFIFYFGIVGLIPMMMVILYSAYVCAKHFRREAWLFVLAALVGLIVWFKVSTDIFLFFALFLSAAALQEDTSKQHA